jgi:GTPase SAR1 family protein
LPLQRPLHGFTVLIVGDSGCGKSSLLVRYTKGDFSGMLRATIGVEFMEKMVTVDDGKKVLAQLWDTGESPRCSLTTCRFRLPNPTDRTPAAACK